MTTLRRWNFACPDWEQRIREGRSLMPDLPLFKAEADMGAAFFDSLRLPDVPETPLLRDAAGEWFREIVRAVFGSRDPATNIRYVPEVLALIGKGNSKTTNSAALMVTALLMNTRPRAEFLFVGPTHAISDLAFNQAVGMVKLDTELDKRFHVREHLKEIRDRLNNSKLRVKTFDTHVLTGPKPVGVLIDELHLLGRDPRAIKVLRQIRGGLQKNPEGFLIIITTQSDDPPAGAFRDELATARKIRDGKLDGRMLPLLYEFPPEYVKPPRAGSGEDPKWYDQRLWHMVMPNLGRSLVLDRLVHDWETERQKGPHAVAVWASQHLNVEVGLALQSDAWAGASHWLDAGDPALTLDEILARSEVVVVGLDGGGLDDLFGLAVIGRETGTRRWLHWAHAWAHRSVLDLRPADAPKLVDLEQAGELTLVASLGEDISEIVDIIEKIHGLGLFPEQAAIGMDQVAVAQIVDGIVDRELPQELIAGIPQGWRLSGAIKTLERKLVDHTFAHGAQALLSWCVGNAKQEPRGNAVSITKQLSGYGKIDPLIATFNAAVLMGQNPEAAGATDYGKHGLLVV